MGTGGLHRSTATVASALNPFEAALPVDAGATQQQRLSVRHKACVTRTRHFRANVKLFNSFCG